jgi:hypothetical protein
MKAIIMPPRSVPAILREVNKEIKKQLDLGLLDTHYQISSLLEPLV